MQLYCRSLTCYLEADENLAHNSNAFEAHGSLRSAEVASADRIKLGPIPCCDAHLTNPIANLQKYNIIFSLAVGNEIHADELKFTDASVEFSTWQLKLSQTSQNKCT